MTEAPHLAGCGASKLIGVCLARLIHAGASLVPSRVAIIPQVHKNKASSLLLADALPAASLPALDPRPRVSLGTYGKIASPPPTQGLDPVASALIERFRLQSAARRLLPLEGVAGCLRRRQAGKEYVELWHLPEVGRAKYGGLQTCSSVWACPVCAAKITERRRLEVREGIDAWNAKGAGYEIVMATFTVRHHCGDELGFLVRGLIKALRRLSAGKMGALMRSRYGIVGNIRSVEVTYGEDNGWHPHIHMLFFVQPGCQFDLLWLHLRKQWDNALRLEKMKDVTSRGVDLRWANEDIAEYVAKMGHERTWNIEHELAKGPAKLGRGEHYSPIQLLSMYADNPNETIKETGEVITSRPGRLWWIYATEMKRTHQLRWSPGLRAMLGLKKEKSDEELAAEADKRGNLLAELDSKEWATVLHFNKRAELLNIASGGSLDAVKDFLTDLDWTLNKDEEERILLSVQPRRLSAELQQLAILNEERDIVRLLRETDAATLGLSLDEYEQWRRSGSTTIRGGGKWERKEPALRL